jgi:hypothetical protein
MPAHPYSRWMHLYEHTMITLNKLDVCIYIRTMTRIVVKSSVMARNFGLEQELKISCIHMSNG